MSKSKHYRAYTTLLLSTVSIGLLLQMQDHLASQKVHDEDSKSLLQDLRTITNRFLTRQCCPRCGAPLYLSDLPQYDYTCYTCDENY